MWVSHSVAEQGEGKAWVCGQTHLWCGSRKCLQGVSQTMDLRQCHRITMPQHAQRGLEPGRHDKGAWSWNKEDTSGIHPDRKINTNGPSHILANYSLDTRLNSEKTDTDPTKMSWLHVTVPPLTLISHLDDTERRRRQSSRVEAESKTIHRKE